MKALKSPLMNRYSASIIAVYDLKVLSNQDQFQRIPKWHSVDLNLADQRCIDNNLTSRFII